MYLQQEVDEVAQALDGKEDKANKQDSLTTDGTGTKYPTVDAVNSELSNKISGSGIINRIPKYTDTKVIGFSNITDNGTSIDINTTSSPNSSKLIFKTTGSGSFIDSYHFISDTYNDIIINQLGGNLGIGKAPSTTEKLDVDGNVRANSYKFTLPTSITAQPNMLIPKVDGTRPIWYNNSSVGNDLAFSSEVDAKLDKPTMTNNYYGLWDDTNKKFIDGNLKTSADGNYVESNLPLSINSTLFKPTLNSESIYLGTVPINVTGTNNSILGYNSGASLTTGYANLLIGTEANKTITTGIGNIILAGWGSGGYNPITGTIEKEITGKHNITLGTSANHNISSASRNTAIGNGALTRNETGNNNIAIGYGSGGSLKSGNNNIFIGSGAGGQASSNTANHAVSNKLCIHTIVNTSTGVGYTTNPSSFWDTAPSPHGMNTWDLGLITGDFFERWVKFNGKFIIGSSYMPNADSTYTKNIVAKEDGTFGWTTGLVSDKLSFTLSTSITPTPNTLVPKTDGSGLMWYNNNSVGLELFTGTPFVYNVPSTITVNHVNVPASPDVPTYIQAIQDRLTQLNQPGVTMQKFTNWNVITYNGITNTNIRVDNNDIINTYLKPFQDDTSIGVETTVISIHSNKILPRSSDWAVQGSISLGSANNSTNNRIFKRLIGLFTSITGGLTIPEIYLSDGINVAEGKLDLISSPTKYVSGVNNTSTTTILYTGNPQASINFLMLKVGDNLLFQLQYADKTLSTIYSVATIGSGDFGFCVSAAKSSVTGTGVGTVSNIRYYIFP